MVEILCPHCEEEIELEDDASGEFACPYCEGEFEWNVDGSSKDDDLEMHGPPPGSGAALRWTMGLIIAIIGFATMAISLFGLFIGSQVSAVDSEIGFGEATGTNLGAGVIIFSLVIGIFGLALAVAGIGAIRRNFGALVACTVLSVLGALGSIGGTFQYYVVMEAWERSVEPNPILGLLMWGSMVAGHMFVMFSQRGREMWME